MPVTEDELALTNEVIELMEEAPDVPIRPLLRALAQVLRHLMIVLQEDDKIQVLHPLQRMLFSRFGQIATQAMIQLLERHT